jgi:hypothetical protein
MFFDDKKELFPSGRVDGYRLECGDRSYRSFLKGCPGFYGNMLIQIDSVALQDLAIEIRVAERPAEGLRGFWLGALLLVSQRPQRVFSFLASRTQPKFAAALLYEPQTWRTNPFR